MDKALRYYPISNYNILKADNVNLQGILNSPNRYIIPIFQRYYSWGKREWSQLWDNLMELQYGSQNPGGGHIETHFMGALVFVPDRRPEYSMPTYQVIDGQQRLITLSILICALRNTARAAGFGLLAAEINDTLLMHPYKQEEEHYRVFPRQRDRDEYLAIIEHKSLGRDRNKLTEALIWFLQQLETLGVDGELTEPELRVFFDQIRIGLDFVYITLDEENPYRIFKSLNSTGMNLNEADLIRNFMLMSAGTRTVDQDRFDDAYWRPLEKLFEDDAEQLNSREFSVFFRDFLMAAGRYIPLSSTFFHFEKTYGQAGFDPRPLTEELQKWATFYNMIRGLVPHESKQVNRALHKLRRLNNSASWPLLLRLLALEAAGGLKTSAFEKAAGLIDKFVRQMFESESATRNLGRWLATACLHLDADPVADLDTYFKERSQK
ncbi:MAG: hypothetical protein ACI9EW_000537 [Cellvibrionaceae bacterium]|jgi:hypothetical protein